MFDYIHRIRCSSSFCGNNFSCKSSSLLDQLVPFSASALVTWEHAQQQHLLVALSDALVVLVVALRLLATLVVASLVARVVWAAAVLLLLVFLV